MRINLKGHYTPDLLQNGSETRSGIGVPSITYRDLAIADLLSSRFTTRLGTAGAEEVMRQKDA